MILFQNLLQQIYNDQETTNKQYAEQQERESRNRSPRSFFTGVDFRIYWKLKKERGSPSFNISKNFLQQRYFINGVFLISEFRF